MALKASDFGVKLQQDYIKNSAIIVFALRVLLKFYSKYREDVVCVDSVRHKGIVKSIIVPNINGVTYVQKAKRHQHFVEFRRKHMIDCKLLITDLILHTSN